ncbi:MAG: hypothetical protein ACJ73N_03135 [Bryobacteraceae bacterium]
MLWWPMWAVISKNGHWHYRLSTIYQAPDITAVLKKLIQDKHAA